MTEAQEERFLREKQEYEDALAAYREVLGGVANSLPMPQAMLSNYSAESQGYERAATDPWVTERFPDLAHAAQKVQAEEGDYLALDEPIASHAQANCSIVAYTGEKFYEYVAMLEAVYLLASDAAFRREVLEKLKTSVWSDILTMIGAYYGADSRAIAGTVNDDIARQNEEMMQAGQEAAGRVNARIAAYFNEVWEGIKRNYRECGLGNTVVKAAIDGAFLVGEIAVGAATLKALKIVARSVNLSGGKKAVAISVQGFASSRLAAQAEIADIVKSVDGKTISYDALEAKYGKPSDNHIGGHAPDANRFLPDKPAEDVLREKASVHQSKDSESHPADRDRPLRSKEQLAPNNRVPTFASGKFNSWWNDLSPEELDMLWADNSLKRQIAAQVRAPGGKHEWLMVAEGPHLKRIGFKMDEIKAMASPTRTTAGPIPGRHPERWRHPTSGDSGNASHDMHQALQDEIAAATSRKDLLQRLGAFAENWLDNGVDDYPPTLRDAIKAVD